MPSNFDLIITADYPSRTAELRLLDEHGVQLVFRQTDFKTITVSRQQGLFDLRNYLRHYVEPGREAASVAEIGVCIGEEVALTQRGLVCRRPRHLPRDAGERRGQVIVRLGGAG